MLVYGTIIYFFTAYSSQQVKGELVRIATDHRNLIDQFLREKTTILQFATASFDRGELSDAPNLESVLKNLQLQSKAFFDLGVFDASGHHVAYAGPFDLAGRSYAEADWFKEVQGRGVYISDEFLGYRRTPHFIIAVKKTGKEDVWYLRATIDTFYFNDLVEGIRIGRTGEAYIVNRQGVLQTQRRSGGHIMETDQDFPRYDISRSAESAAFTDGGLRNGFLYASAPIHQTDWILIVRQSIDDAYALLATALLISFLLLLGGGGLVVLMGFFMASNVASRLKLADIEKREMKTQLILAGKLAEVGEMSTGIAHEINNPLQVMKSEVALAHALIGEIEAVAENESGDSLDQLKDSIREMGEQIDRCGRITQGLLNFARKREATREVISMERFVPKMVQLVDQRARLDNIRIIQEIESDLPEITSDAAQLQQVFLNLFNNAIYALKDRSPAEIRVRVKQENDDILIRIADNGCGFSPEHMEKAFLPFFTTKPVGQGTGLGLSTVYGIIKSLDGDITLTSEQGAGSEFQIRLPSTKHGNEKEK
jgi:two-component system NtrC family sensor kinase